VSGLPRICLIEAKYFSGLNSIAAGVSLFPISSSNYQDKTKEKKAHPENTAPS
jgi:hypothetical protein